MSPVYTLKVAINGSETDINVEGDTASWLTKVGDVKVTDGGGSWHSPPQQAGCTIRVNVPISLAPLIRTVTIAVVGPYSGTIPAWLTETSTGSGRYYRVIFHGPVTSVQPAAAIGDDGVLVNAISEMQTLFERRAHTAASNNSGCRSLCNDIETAHSITINENTSIPQAADTYQLDRPAQKDATNGEWLKTLMAGHGYWITAEWDGPIDSPQLCWRTDYPWTSGRWQQVRAGRPWKYVYEDYGFTWQDFVARVEVDGTDSAANKYYGWARLNDSTVRSQLGNQEVRFSSWIDSATQCQTAARKLIRQQGEPYLKMLRVGIPLEICYRDAATAAGYTEDEDKVFMGHACLMLGDQLLSRSSGSNSWDNTSNTAGSWPSGKAATGSIVFSDLSSLWEVNIVNTTTDKADNYTVRGIAREWEPSGGWYITVDLEPDGNGGDTAGDYGNAAY